MFSEANRSWIPETGQLVLFDERDRSELAWEVHRIVRELHLEPPVNAHAIASARGIVGIREVAQDVPGYLFREGKALAVHVRQGDPRQRQRFTILHEAGHTLLRDFTGEIEYRCADLAATRKEQLANVVAAEFLFPWDFYEGDLGFTGLTLAGIEFLARRYQASLEASAVHAVERWSQPAMLAVIRADLPGKAPGTLNPIYTRGARRWPLTWQGRSLISNAVVRTALSRRHSCEVIPWVDDTGTCVSLRVEAGLYPLTLGGQRRARLLALYREVEPDRGSG